MNNAPKTETLLAELLAQQHKTRSPGIFKEGKFAIAWRAKVGSFPYPNLETIVSAAEPCGRFDWRSQENADTFHYHKPLSRDSAGESDPSYFGNLTDLLRHHRSLPLRGYIPGSAIRGLIRSWAMRRPDKQLEAIRLLGHQDDDRITPGKIVFLDAWPEVEASESAQLLSLDIVNPQQDFQVYHQPQGSTPQACNPQAIYTLGDGKYPLIFKVAIRGIPDSTRGIDKLREDVEVVWEWVTQALSLYGIGGRTASGYGVVHPRLENRAARPRLTLEPGYKRQSFDFELYSQGCFGVDKDDRRNPELRPSHWRGWLRSWALRFLLGVLPRAQAEEALADLFGAIEPQARKGCVRIKMRAGQIWGDASDRSISPMFYLWKGQLEITAPSEVMTAILLPIIKFATSVGGVGHGWRRPLHIFYMNNGRPAARGCFLDLRERKKTPKGIIDRSLMLPLEADWKQLYSAWQASVQAYWSNRNFQFSQHPNISQQAEIFSPHTCSIYALPGPYMNPIDEEDLRWQLYRNQVNVETAEDTRGDGVTLIYSNRYKRNTEVGGDAGRGSASCSWVSIRRVIAPHESEETDCQEIVCLFLGPQDANGFHPDRFHFLRKMDSLIGAKHLFGVRAQAET